MNSTANRSVVFAAVVAATAALLAAVVWSLTQGSAMAASGELSMSNAGTAVSLSSDSKGAIDKVNRARNLGLGGAYRMAQRGDRTFYRVDGGTGICFATGKKAQLQGPVTLGVLVCGDKSTARTRRLFDFSLYEIDPRADEIQLLRLEGFAVDGVASVGVRASEGNLIARVPVVENVFQLDRVPSAPVAELVAFSAHGSVIDQVSYAR